MKQKLKNSKDSKVSKVTTVKEKKKKERTPEELAKGGETGHEALQQERSYAKKESSDGLDTGGLDESVAATGRSDMSELVDSSNDL